MLDKKLILTKDIYHPFITEENIHIKLFGKPLNEWFGGNIIYNEAVIDANDFFFQYPWNLFELRKEIASRYPKGYISTKAKIASSAIIGEDAYIDDGAVIHEGACIKGKSYIGVDSVVGNNAFVRDSNIGSNVVVGAFSHIARSIIMHHTESHGGGFVGDSIIGPYNHMAGGFTTSNWRLDHDYIACKYEGNTIKTPYTYLGIMTGEYCAFGINTSTMPGRIVGSHVTVWPQGIVFKNMDHHMTLKPEYHQEIFSS